MGCFGGGWFIVLSFSSVKVSSRVVSLGSARPLGVGIGIRFPLPLLLCFRCRGLSFSKTTQFLSWRDVASDFLNEECADRQIGVDVDVL